MKKYLLRIFSSSLSSSSDEPRIPYLAGWLWRAGGEHQAACEIQGGPLPLRMFLLTCSHLLEIFTKSQVRNLSMWSQQRRLQCATMYVLYLLARPPPFRQNERSAPSRSHPLEFEGERGPKRERERVEPGTRSARSQGDWLRRIYGNRVKIKLKMKIVLLPWPLFLEWQRK